MVPYGGSVIIMAFFLVPTLRFRLAPTCLLSNHAKTLALFMAALPQKGAMGQLLTYTVAAYRER